MKSTRLPYLPGRWSLIGPSNNPEVSGQFNIGIQAAGKPRSFELAVSPEILKTVAQLRAQLVITVYAEAGQGASMSGAPPNK